MLISSVACIINLITRSMNTLRISSHHPKWIAQSSTSPTSVYRILRSFAFVDVTRLHIPFCSTQPCACSCALGLSWTDKIISGRLCTCKLKTQLRTLKSQKLKMLGPANTHVDRVIAANKAPSSWFLVNHHPAQLAKFPSPWVFWISSSSLGPQSKK